MSAREVGLGSGGGPIQSPLLNNPSEANLHFVDWYGLSESNLPESPAVARSAAAPAMQIPSAESTGRMPRLWRAVVEAVRRSARAMVEARMAHAERLIAEQAARLVRNGEDRLLDRDDPGSRYY